jgi:hypothetical protein
MYWIWSFLKIVPRFGVIATVLWYFNGTQEYKAILLCQPSWLIMVHTGTKQYSCVNIPDSQWYTRVQSNTPVPTFMTHRSKVNVWNQFFPDQAVSLVTVLALLKLPFTLYHPGNVNFCYRLCVSYKQFGSPSCVNVIHNWKYISFRHKKLTAGSVRVLFYLRLLLVVGLFVVVPLLKEWWSCCGWLWGRSGCILLVFWLIIRASAMLDRGNHNDDGGINRSVG